MSGTSLRLADGTSWGITAGNFGAEAMVGRLAEVMRLDPGAGSTHGLRLTVVDDPSFREDPVFGETSVEYRLGRPVSEDMLATCLQQVSQFIGLASEAKGGILLHGALIERDGEGVILTGPGGAGKSTAAARVPAPWTHLCDDTTLVVRDGDGAYRAHPWPTWSSFMFGGPGGTWATEHSVLLRGVYVLEQSAEDRADPLGGGEAACLLNECGEQVTWTAFHLLAKEQVRGLRSRRFDNICAMVRSIPVFRLRLTLTGAFWDEIRRVL